jgi:hypothetical protein
MGNPDGEDHHVHAWQPGAFSVCVPLNMLSKHRAERETGNEAMTSRRDM